MKLRVLICDDSPMIHYMLSNLLAKLDYEVFGIAHDGQEAIEQCARALPDVILLDITMPVMNGLEAAQQILQNHEGIKIIIVSAMADIEIQEQAKALGVYAYLKKPIDDEQLAALLEAVEKEKAHG